MVSRSRPTRFEINLQRTYSIPLCFIYPPMLHLKGCAETRRAKVIDYTLIVFGTIVWIYSTVQTVRSLADGPASSPRLGKCEVPKGQ